MPFDFDIDKYLNRIIPRPRLYALPYPIARFLGYRGSHEETRIKDATVWIWSFIGAFIGLITVELTFIHIGGRLEELDVPMIVGSFGATAILLYSSIDAPLSQPRNVIFGQLLAAIIGVAVTKLFLLSSHFDDIIWVAAAVSCGLASSLMGITKTVHPPAGATALLAASDASIRNLGWWYIPVVLLSAIIMMGVALILNNIDRRYPKYWWTPVSLAKPKDQPLPGELETEVEGNEKLEKQRSRASKHSTLNETEIVITAEEIRMPPWLREAVGDVQYLVLEEMVNLIREHKEEYRREHGGDRKEAALSTENGSHNTLVSTGSSASVQHAPQ